MSEESESTADPRLRDVVPGDLEALYRLDQACFESGIAYSRAQIQFFLSRPDACALVAEAERGLAGFVIGHRAGSVGHIVTIDVSASQRRRGIGRLLLSEVVRRLAASGAREIRLEVDLRNGKAIRFYEGLGFRETRRLPDYYGRRRDGLEMVRGVSEGER